MNYFAPGGNVSAIFNTLLHYTLFYCLELSILHSENFTACTMEQSADPSIFWTGPL